MAERIWKAYYISGGKVENRPYYKGPAETLLEQSSRTDRVVHREPFSSEETNAYNTAHWTNPPVANCRRVRSFLLSPADQALKVTMAWETVCHTDGSWLIRRTTNEKEIQTMQTTLASLKAKTEEAAKGH
jgi:hypothetical protein